MAQRKKPYMVGIPASKMPPTELSVEATLLALDKLVERYVRKYKGHPKLMPSAPFVTLTLASGQKASGILRRVTEESVAIFPQKTRVWYGSLSGRNERDYIDFESPKVVRANSIDAVEYSLLSRIVYPTELSC